MMMTMLSGYRFADAGSVFEDSRVISTSSFSVCAVPMRQVRNVRSSDQRPVIPSLPSEDGVPRAQLHGLECDVIVVEIPHDQRPAQAQPSI